MYENAYEVLDQAEHKKHYGGLTERFDRAKARLEQVKEIISDKQTRQAMAEAFLDEFKRLDGVGEFQAVLWYGLADCMTVYSKDDVRVRFKDGTEIRACPLPGFVRYLTKFHCFAPFHPVRRIPGILSFKYKGKIHNNAAWNRFIIESRAYIACVLPTKFGEFSNLDYHNTRNKQKCDSLKLSVNATFQGCFASNG